MGATVFSIAVFAVCIVPLTEMRHYELALARAETLAASSAFLLWVGGGVTCFACLCCQVEPPPRLVRFTLVAMLLFAFVMLCFPAIAVA